VNGLPVVVLALTMPVSIVVGSTQPPAASASIDDYALNGTFIATSNGDWAKTRDSYHAEATVRSTWTIASTCNDAYDCTGHVSSDKGWSAPIRRDDTTWIVDRDIPNWEPCPDGTAHPGHQKYRFYQVDSSGFQDLTGQSPVFAGEDKTVGQSGACGVSKWLTIRMPFSLQRIG
jgi:hypothetical protein